MTNRISAIPAAIPNFAEMQAATKSIEPYSMLTPLVRLNAYPGATEIFLKLENLQDLGAFKIRPVSNILRNIKHERLQQGVYTASSGNAGFTLAWMARELAIPVRVYAPESSPTEKLDLIRQCEAEVRIVSDKEWWQIIESSGHPDEAGCYIDAVRAPLALAGNATIGLEIVQQLPEVDTVIVPFGGGGVACGIAAALRALKPGVRIIAAESTAATPLSSAFESGRPVQVPVTDSFISGAGAPCVLAEMWPMLQSLIDETHVVSVDAVMVAIHHLLVFNHVVAEGAGAISVAAAMAGAGGTGKTVCVVTGGNISAAKLATILNQTE